MGRWPLCQDFVTLGGETASQVENDIPGHSSRDGMDGGERESTYLMPLNVSHLDTPHTHLAILAFLGAGLWRRPDVYSCDLVPVTVFVLSF